MERSAEPTRAGEASWPRVVRNTIALSRQRRRERRLDTEPESADWLLRGKDVLVLGIAASALIGLGVAAFLLLPGLRGGDDADRASAGAGAQLAAQEATEQDRAGQDRTVPSTAAQQQAARTPPGSQAEPAGQAARARAGRELVTRPGLAVSPPAAEALRTGIVDGRVLLVLATLANDGRLTGVDVPPGPDALADPGALEFTARDVDEVLAWLDTQPKLAPDRVEVRREDASSAVRLLYDSPEPRGLFPS